MRAFFVAAVLSCLGGCAAQTTVVAKGTAPIRETSTLTPAAVLDTMLVAYASGRLSRAQCELLASLPVADIEPSNGRFNLGVLLQSCSDSAGARRAYATIACADTEYAAALNNSGVLVHDEAHTSEARRWFALALRYEPAMPTATRNLGRIETNAYAESGDFEAFENAESEFRSLLWGNPRDTETRESLALLYYARALRGESSYRVLGDFVIDAEPGYVPSAENWTVRGLLELRDDQPLRALRAFEKAIETQPSAVAPRVNAAYVLAEVRDFAPVLAHLEAISSEVAGTLAVEVFLSIGTAKLGLWEFDGAAQAYEHAKSLDPRDPRADFNLGLLNLIRVGYVDTAGVEEMRAARRHFEAFVATAAFDTRAPAALERARDALVAIDRWIDEPHSCRIEPEARRLEELQRLQEAQERRRLLELEARAKAALEAMPPI